MLYATWRLITLVLIIQIHFHLCEQEQMPTVEWFAPFLSGGGYCTEAIALAASINTVANMSYHFRVTHHGDSVSGRFIDGKSLKQFTL